MQTNFSEESLIRYRSQAGEMLRWAGIAHWNFVVQKGILEISDEFLISLGYNPQDLYPLTLDRWGQLIHPDDRHVLSAFGDVLTRRIDLLDTIFRMKTASGSWRYFRGRGGVVETNSIDNTVIRLSGTIQDLSDMKIVNAALQRRDQLLAAVNEAANILLAAQTEQFDQSVLQVLHILGTVTNVDRVYVWHNELIEDKLHCSQIYEWSPQAKPQQGTEFTTKIKYSEMIPTWDTRLGAGECINGIVHSMSRAEQDQLLPQGIVSILVAPVLLGDKFWGFVGFDDCQNERVWDKTEVDILKSAGMLLATAIKRHNVEMELTRERKTLDWILETSPIAIVTSLEGHVSRLNKQCRTLFALAEGMSLSEIHAKVLGEYKGRLNFDLVFKEMVETGIFSRNIQFPCADEVIRDFILTTLFLEPDNFQQSISWIVDITDLKETERALIQSRDKAEIATKAKSEFLARMSHEIRTPMNAILGMIYLCLQTNVDEKQRDYLVKTQSAANNLLGIINDILDVSKIESGKLDLELIPFSLKKTIGEVIDIIRPSAEEKGLKLVTKIDSDINDSLVGDPLRLRQILLNLTNNAVKFTDKGGIIIAVTQEESRALKDSNKVRLAFEVKDTGIGLKADQIENVFESFSQADGTITRKYGGTGLGLAIVKSLVELMEGHVNVTSIPGQGATFSFTVVVTQSDREPDMSSTMLLSKRRVLIIDDDENDLAILTELMQSMHMNVMSVRTGATALEKLEEATYLRTPFELVLIDWRMPRMDGIETIRRIRQNDKITPPFIVVVSAYDRQECLRHVQGLNVSDVMIKPVHPNVLKETLKATFREDLTKKTDEIRADIRGAKVLLAEDNKINQMVASELLRMLNIELTIANNGIEAVNAVRKNGFDLILMDIQMPEMDGLTATQAIRNLDKPGIDKLPILAMTANALDTDYQRSLEVGMNDHLTKPIEPEKLRTALEKWIVR